MVSTISTSSAIQDAANTQGQQSQLTQDFDEFLQLLTVQLQNQDPLSPMDTTEMTNQIVQFSQAEQQINMNQKLNDLVELQLASMGQVALSYVGLDASYVSNEAFYDGEKPIQFSFTWTGEPISGKVNIVNEAGDLIYTMDAPLDSGRHDLTWDGTTNGGGQADPGTYIVDVGGLDIDDNPVDKVTVVTGTVQGVESQDGIPFLLIGERAVPLSGVINAKTPTVLESTTEASTDGEETAEGSDNTETTGI